MSNSDTLPQLNSTTPVKSLKETQQDLLKVAKSLLNTAVRQKQLSAVVTENAEIIVMQKNIVADLEARMQRLETNTDRGQGRYQGNT